MIGKIYWSVFPYFDMKTRQNRFKKRPVLIIAGPHNNDYTVLPVSSVSIRSNLHPKFDIILDPVAYPELRLSKTCYLRTHKQTIVHQAELTNLIGDLKHDYPDTYLKALELLEEFNSLVMNQAL